MSRRFDDDEYVTDARTGKFPKIHDDVATLVREYAADDEPALDLGAATGVLAAQLLAIGRTRVYAVEPHAARRERGVVDDRIVWINQRILTYGDVNSVITAIVATEARIPTLCVARRSLYEFGAKDVHVVTYLGDRLKAIGVQDMVIEGCVPVAKPAVKLWHSDLEFEALSKNGSWKCAARRGRALYLKAVA